MRKKILIASSAFYPENSPRSFRATELAKELVRQGHHVTVITLDRGEVTRTFCKAHGIDLKYLPKLLLKPVRIPNGRLSIFFRALNRMLLLLLEYPDLELAFRYKSALRSKRGYDLLLSFAVPYPVHWGVAWAQGKKKKIAKVWVADCGDPYMGDLSDSFKKMFYFKYVEQFTFRRADHIAIPIETARAAYYEEFHPKMQIIPQGLDFDEFTKGLPVFTPNKTITFGYAGSFIMGKRDPRMFLDYLLTQKIDYRFVIFTNAPALVADYAARSEGKVVIRPYIPRQELIHTLAAMDFLVNFENSTVTQAPSKLIDYYLTGRPVLSIPSNRLNKAEIDQFLNRDFTARVPMQGYEQYRIQNVSVSFLNLMNKTN
ncbi:glycosyltransferase [Fulvivirgaceae bacterium PWU4]|uniref:Glycosyltransferase n=1 Tax=Chryseosolibacter histidini TaxID=2782349 RepID=A0AAP2DT04_9BACT|nr:glycosyltransferase [Chryseosolibacter histidini]MBT1700527.1 glycosyltransferase [Chryseosolibacter histidini]